ncbi:MAG: metal ABC transporter permease [Saprospiraceae bacterium]
MEVLKEFFSFQDSSIWQVTLGVVLLTAAAAVVGTFTFLKKQALTGDAVAHAVLPGVCLAFILSGTRNPLVLMAGALVTGWLSLIVMETITKRSKLKEDTAIALVLSVFFGIGILLLTYIQHNGNAAQSGLDSFLFGKAASLVGRDLWVFGIIGVLLTGLVTLFFKELKLIAFDEAYAISIGLPVKGINLLLTTLTVLAVVTGIQAVGVVLMAAVLITPAAAARYWTEDVGRMTAIAAVMGAFAGLTGAFISFTAPAMPTGPWIVVVISVIAIFSFMLAPRRGVVFRAWEQRRLQQTMMDENILKALFHLEESDNDPDAPRSVDELSGIRLFPVNRLRASLKRLHRQGWLQQRDGHWQFTVSGRERGRRMAKLHRLWEVYLSEYLKIAPDHVHDDAENIEHIITPELEARLEQLLKWPEVDPHDEKIPY